MIHVESCFHHITSIEIIRETQVWNLNPVEHSVIDLTAVCRKKNKTKNNEMTQ